ncbi:hypothetical protein BJ165DRAFT_349846 [Panaeolus papilionaceus]|nr:hypothetical protein BJ165DRAFT_349846 [Panaeolus papilionaceus]
MLELCLFVSNAGSHLGAYLAGEGTMESKSAKQQFKLSRPPSQFTAIQLRILDSIELIPTGKTRNIYKRRVAHNKLLKFTSFEFLPPSHLRNLTLVKAQLFTLNTSLPSTTMQIIQRESNPPSSPSLTSPSSDIFFSVDNFDAEFDAVLFSVDAPSLSASGCSPSPTPRSEPYFEATPVDEEQYRGPLISTFCVIA